MDVQKAGCEMVRFRSGEQQRQTFCAPPNNGECSIMVVPLVVIQESAGSTPVIHPKHEMLGFDSRRAVRFEDPTLKLVVQHLTKQCIGSSGVEQLVEAQRGGGSNPSRCTNFILDHYSDPKSTF